MSDTASQMDLDARIALIRNNISDLMEQAAGASGAGTEESIAERLNEQQDALDALLKQRDGTGQG